MNIRMWHDWCLVKMESVPVGSLVMPDSAIQGKEFIVEAIGPEVEDLQVGDKVLMRGTYGAEYYPLPSDSKKLVIQEKNVVLVFEGEQTNG